MTPWDLTHRYTGVHGRDLMAGVLRAALCREPANVRLPFEC
jgi:hypothetical protein